MQHMFWNRNLIQAGSISAASNISMKRSTQEEETCRQTCLRELPLSGREISEAWMPQQNASWLSPICNPERWCWFCAEQYYCNEYYGCTNPQCAQSCVAQNIQAWAQKALILCSPYIDKQDFLILSYKRCTDALLSVCPSKAIYGIEKSQRPKPPKRHKPNHGAAARDKASCP